jgi:hypothetical protein
LATILRDYLAKQQNLPGVRSGVHSPPWPSPQSSRPTPASSVNNGGDYVASRRSLLTRYAARWLLALHDQDPASYTALVYDICVELVEDGPVGTKLTCLQPGEEKKVNSIITITQRPLHSKRLADRKCRSMRQNSTSYHQTVTDFRCIQCFRRCIPSMVGISFGVSALSGGNSSISFRNRLEGLHCLFFAADAVAVSIVSSGSRGVTL